MSEIVANLLYSKEHEWIKVLDEKRILVGITDFAQAQLGDIVFIELPEISSDVTADESMGSVESVKAVSDIYSPVSGKIVLINKALEANPELVNLEPYTTGWIAEIEISGPDALEGLLTAAEYESLIGEA
ncbi:glycine cleavage system protein GcvH [Paenibacillus psychroresistens]|uniref:Glycine cleavage system H protein n=1 Tax=Paenibacillus psychroresistens TaxID=1778678 RepID=A0A6B8RNT0_9BACL|nr:glycine cleavage system protein GcvH [Paenibacillus psychroresistens]QGQ97990.1 glycine cleavage system protein GcvH [Paenibacillus psychroresistens]